MGRKSARYVCAGLLPTVDRVQRHEYLCDRKEVEVVSALMPIAFRLRQDEMPIINLTLAGRTLTAAAHGRSAVWRDCEKRLL